MRNNSFSSKLSRHILLVSSLIFLGALGFSSLYSHIIVAEEAKSSARNLLHSTVNQIETIFGRVEKEVSSMAWLVDEHKYDENYLYHITRKVVDDSEVAGCAIAFEKNYFEDKYYFSPYSYRDELTGEILSKQLGSASYDYFYSDWYQIPSLIGEACWSEPYYDEGGARVMMTTYSYPIKDENGHIYAIITADLTLDWLNEIIAGIEPYPSSTVSLTSRSGLYVCTSTGADLQGETLFSTAMSTGNESVLKIAEDIVGGKDGLVRYTINGVTSYAVYGPLSNGWSLSITCALKEVLSRASMMLMITLLIALLGLTVLFFVCRYTIKRLTNPLSSISDSAIKIANGDFNTALPEINTGDEVQQLRDSFDFMEKSLVDYIENLKNTTAANERMESELNIANKIQMALLSRDFPHLENLDLHALMQPAKQVGGDLYDFFIKDNCLHFAVGDVSGKGIPASIFMAITKALYRYISNMGLEVNEVITKLNDAISENNESGMFVTMFIGCLDLETGLLKYCNAGHNPVVVNGEFLNVKPNLAVGLIPGFPYVLQQCSLEKGARIILYTDGVTEAEKSDKEQYGNDRLLAWTAMQNQQEDAETACKLLYSDVKDFVEGNEQNDDITIMTIKYK